MVNNEIPTGPTAGNIKSFHEFLSENYMFSPSTSPESYQKTISDAFVRWVDECIKPQFESGKEE